MWQHSCKSTFSPRMKLGLHWGDQLQCEYLNCTGYNTILRGELCFCSHFANLIEVQNLSPWQAGIDFVFKKSQATFSSEAKSTQFWYSLFWGLFHLNIVFANAVWFLSFFFFSILRAWWRRLRKGRFHCYRDHITSWRKLHTEKMIPILHKQSQEEEGKKVVWIISACHFYFPPLFSPGPGAVAMPKSYISVFTSEQYIVLTLCWSTYRCLWAQEFPSCSL